MVKGGWTKDTKVISIRILATDYSMLERRRDRLEKRLGHRGLSVGDYIKWVLTRKHTKGGV